MADDEHLERVRLLREQGRSPKEIARILGIRPAEASRLVRAAAVLAPGLGTISFGKDGKPLYVFGSYDDHRSVIKTLTRTVGQGNFEVLAIAG